jgi:hypothetical protein
MKPWHKPLTATERWATVAALVVASLLCWPLRNYLTDDTFIHLRYAENLATGHGLVFNPGERVYGCTSPLWVVLIADLMALGMDGLAAARLLGWLSMLASVACFMQLARRVLMTPAARAAAVVAWSTHAWFIRWSLSGMETPLATALVLAGFVAFTEGERWGARPIRTGALWSLAALARPEAGLLLILWGLFLILDARERDGIARLFFGLLPPILIYGSWLFFSHLYFGTFWPQTLAAKSAGTASAEFAWANLRRQAMIVGATEGLLIALMALAFLFGMPRLWRVRRSWTEEALPVAWILCLPPLYALRGVPVLSRYLVPVAAIVAVWAWRSLEAWWSPRGPEPSTPRPGLFRVAVAVVALGVAVQNFTVYRTKVLPQVRSFTVGMEESLVRWGKWFARHTPPGTLIAVPDIGAIGFYSGRPVLDLAGLVTPAMVPFLARETPEEVVARFRFAAIARPAYLVDRSDSAYSLPHASPYGEALVPVGTARVPNLGIARPTPAWYSVYRIDWERYDELRGQGPPPPP